MDIPRNYNRHLTSEPFNYERVQNSFSCLKKGIVTNTYSVSGRIGMFYDVRLLDSGVTLSGVKCVLQNGGLNGEGEYFSYDVDTPVLLLFNEGKLGQGEGFIIGSFTTEGDFNSFYTEGKLQNYNERLDGELFNQPFNHPNRVSQEDAYFKVINARNVDSVYDNSEFYTEDADRDKARSVPGIIEMHNREGTSVRYNLGDSITYVDGNHIVISGGKKKTKCESYMELSKRHLKKAKLFNGTVAVTDTDEQQSQETVQSPLIKQLSTDGFVFSKQSVVQQELVLASVYCDLAKKCNEMGSAQLSVVNDMNSSFSSWDAQGNVNGTQVSSNFKPKETTATVPPSNYGDRVYGNSGTLPPMIVVLHETVSDTDSAVKTISNPKNEVSYHAIVDLSGEIVYLTNSTKRAYGSGTPSSFNGQSYNNSVNGFAYQISLETPVDVRTNAATHSGYTQAQYQSLAWLVARTGIPRNRITTHKAVAEAAGRNDRSDPRSFDWKQFDFYLNQFESKGVIDFGI